jgi:hypothetical protein
LPADGIAVGVGAATDEGEVGEVSRQPGAHADDDVGLVSLARPPRPCGVD